MKLNGQEIEVVQLTSQISYLAAEYLLRRSFYSNRNHHSLCSCTVLQMANANIKTADVIIRNTVQSQADSVRDTFLKIYITQTEKKVEFWLN